MQITPEISFRDFEPGPAVKERVLEEVRRLEHFYDGIIGCRVVMENPHRRHRIGNTYHVRIDITVPGRGLVVSRDPAEEPTRSDPFVVIEGAFAAARRQLGDYAREIRGQVKAHEEPPHGRIARLFPTDGYGFIRSSNGPEIYFHENSVLDASFEDLAVGDEVRFVEEPGIEGPQASTVHPVGKHERGGEGRGSRCGARVTLE